MSRWGKYDQMWRKSWLPRNNGEYEQGILHTAPYAVFPYFTPNVWRTMYILSFAETIKSDADHRHQGIMVNIKQCALYTQPNALFPSSTPKVWCTMFVLSQRWLNCKNNTDIVGCWHCWNSDCISRTIVAAIFSPFLPVVARKCVDDQRVRRPPSQLLLRLVGTSCAILTSKKFLEMIQNYITVS